MNDLIDSIARRLAVLQDVCSDHEGNITRAIMDAMDAVRDTHHDLHVARHGDTVSISDGLTEISVRRDGTWTLEQTPIQGIRPGAYLTRSIAGAIRAGHMAANDRYGALLALLGAGDYLDTPWRRIVGDLTDIQVITDRDGCRASMPGAARSVSVDRTDRGWSVCDAGRMTYSWASDNSAVAAAVIADLTRDDSV